MCKPIEASRINNTAADVRAVTVHIFCCGMGDDIRTELKRTAVYGSCKGIVDNERNAVSMCRICKSLDIKNGKCGVCDSFSEHGFGIRSESLFKLFVRAIGRNECKVYPHLLHGNGEKVICTAVDGGGRYDVVACVCDVEGRIEICRLSRGREHGGDAAFKLAYLLCHGIAGGILQSGIEIARSLKVKELSHILAGIVFKGCTLVNRYLTGFAVSGRITALYANRFKLFG